MSKFAVRYEEFCQVVLQLLVVNAAIVWHTLKGFIVLGIMPSIGATHALYRTWLMDADRHWSLSRTWRTFAEAWHKDLGSANKTGWAFAGFWALMAVDFAIMENAEVGTLGLIASGLLIATGVGALAFTPTYWLLRSHYDEPPRELLRSTVRLVLARPAYTAVLLASAFIALWLTITWPAITFFLGLAPLILAVCAIGYSFARVPGMSAHDRAESRRGPRFELDPEASPARDHSPAVL